MKASYRKQGYCLTCRKYLEEEFREPHKDLGHKVEDYVVGGYKAVDEPIVDANKPVDPDLSDWPLED